MVTSAARKKAEKLAQAVLDARDGFPDATLVDLYDSNIMPSPLRKAHHALDRTVDRLYRKKPSASDHDRLQHLFKRYQAMKKLLV